MVNYLLFVGELPKLIHSQKSLVLFFTKGVSLSDWVKIGIFSREKLIYEELLKRNKFKKIYWITYGSKDKEVAKSLHERNELDKRIIVLEKNQIFKSDRFNLLYSFYLIFKFSNIISKASILKTNQINGSWSALISKFLFNKPMYLRCGFVLSKSEKMWSKKNRLKIFIMTLLEKIVFSLSDVSSVTSESDKKYIADTLKITKSPLVIKSFIDTNIFKSEEKRNLKVNQILFIGRISYEKNLLNILKAVNEHNLTLNIVGSGPERENLEEFSLKNNLKIKFLGNINNKVLNSTINDFDYFILCSLSEGLPKSLLEALSAERICIGSNVTGISSIIKDEINGFLSKNNEVNEISSTIKRAINFKDKQFIKENARKTILKDYDFESFYKKVNGLIDGAIN